MEIGDRKGNLRVKGAGTLWMAGEERAGSGIPEVVGSHCGRNKEKVCYVSYYFVIEKKIGAKMWGQLRKTGDKRYGKREVPDPLTLPPRFPTH